MNHNGPDTQRSHRRERRAALALAAVALFGCEPGDDSTEPSGATGPNILLIVVDTLRSDHLPFYGYERPTAPSLSALAERSWVFENHIAQASQTIPSTVSMMISQYPADHGLVHLFNGQWSRSPPHYREDMLFVSEVFQSAGYETGAFIANPFLKRSFGFSQGFGRFVDTRRGDMLTVQALEWVSQMARKGDKPFFGYLHYIDVHNPYEHPDEYARLYRKEPGGRLVYYNGPALLEVSEEDLHYTVASYDAGINYVDDQLGKLLTLLDELGIRNETLVVFTSDHGDEFLEHGGLGHGTHVYGELIRVPLLMSLPGKFDGGLRISHLTGHIDLAPTLLDVAGITVPQSFKGGTMLEPADQIFADTRTWRAVYAKDHKLVYNIESGEKRLFAQDDALDQHPKHDAAIQADLEARLARYVRAERERKQSEVLGESSPAPAWSQSQLDQLKALGYVGD